MTELEKIEYAKIFIDQLADGINPLDNKPLREEDAANNVRLSRCFFYVSDILRQVIENGGVGKKQYVKIKKENFEISPERLSMFSFSDKPLTISEITKRLNVLKENEYMKNISHRDFTSWLIYTGFLTEQARVDGKMHKIPTAQGEAIGITVEMRTSQYGTRPVTVYSREAQGFLIDNLEAVIAFKQSK